MDVVTIIIALIGAITGCTSIVWQIRNDMRRIKVIFLGSSILLINHTRRPINIESVGYIYNDGTLVAITEPTFDSVCIVPAEDQKDVEIGNKNLIKNAKYAYTRDVLGKEYRTRIKKGDIEFFLQDLPERTETV